MLHNIRYVKGPLKITIQGAMASGKTVMTNAIMDILREFKVQAEITIVEIQQDNIIDYETTNDRRGIRVTRYKPKVEENSIIRER